MGLSCSTGCAAHAARGGEDGRRRPRAPTARRFVRALAANGTTTALVFGAHFAAAQEALFEEAEEVGLRIASGLVRLRPQPAAGARGHAGRGLRAKPRADRALAQPRPAALRRHAALLGLLHRGDARRLRRADGRDARTRCSRARQREPERDRRSSPSCSPAHATTSTPTSGPGCCGERSVLAHNVHVVRRRARRLAAARARVAHCPSSNAFLGSRHLPDGPPPASTACASGSAPTSARAPA